MVENQVPREAKTLFSKPVTPEFWLRDSPWNPLSADFEIDSSVSHHPASEEDMIEEMWEAAREYEQRHGVTFKSLTQFSKPLLNEIHSASESPDSDLENVTVVSDSDQTVLADIETLSLIANSDELTPKESKEYFQTLISIYKKLPRTPFDAVVDKQSAVCVGIKREGYQLCQEMNWFVSDHKLAPDMKRIPYRDGLLVGMTHLPQIPFCETVVIVDGAIASGATIITLIERLRTSERSPEIHIFAVHGGYEGIRAITRFCKSTGIRVSLTIGHATHGISKKFYAVDANNRVVVGDMGDTINAGDARKQP